MKLINLYGGPGTGKSTTSAIIFAKLKQLGYNAELVPEFAKDLTWHNRHATLQDQLYILGKQHHRIFMLKDQVEYIVTDSPLMLSVYYNHLTRANMPKSFDQLVYDLWDSYDSIDVFLERSKEYNPSGRNQTEDEAHKIDRELRELLEHEAIPFTTCGTDDAGIDHIMKLILGDKYE